MASVENGEFEEIGDRLTIQLDPIQKVVDFNFFDDSVTGETQDKFLVKEYQYSRDGFNWTNWKSLTDPNLQAIQTDLLKPYYFRVRYTRAGTDSSGTIVWEYFYLDATVDPNADTSFCSIVFSQPNLFCDINVDDVDFVEMCANLTDKVMKYGVVPEFISDDGKRTEDYYHYWKTICCFFSLLYIFDRRFENIRGRSDMLDKYLSERGLFLCGDEDLLTLQDLASSYYDIVRRRGTRKVDEEIKRLLCSVDGCDEFAFGQYKNFWASWTVDKASPLYRGVRQHDILDKWGELTRNVNTLGEYHLLNSNNISLSNDTDNDGDAVSTMEINPATQTSGVRQNGSNKDHLFTADPSFDQELSFIIETGPSGFWSFGIDAWDSDGNPIPDPCYDVVTGLETKWFFHEEELYTQGYFWQVRGLLFKNSKSIPAGDQRLERTNILLGNNLRLKSNVCKIYPILILKPDSNTPQSDNWGKVYDLKGNIAHTPFSTCFVELSNFLVIIGTNSNPSSTDEEVKRIIDRYLVPVTTHYQTVGF